MINLSPPNFFGSYLQGYNHDKLQSMDKTSPNPPTRMVSKGDM